MPIFHKAIPRAAALLAAFWFVEGTLLAADPSLSAETSANKPYESTKTEGKFLPLPIFITEPAIGEGLGASLIYFHGQEDRENPRATTAREISKTAEHSKAPPTATGIFGFYTNSDSAAVGIGHSNSFQDDNYRLLAAGAQARINSQLYISDAAFDFRLEGEMLFAKLKRRLGDSNAFVGLSMSYMNAETRFYSGIPALDDTDLLRSNFVDAGLAASLIYDNRDNTMMPESGYLVDLTDWRHNESLGGDFDYRITKLKALYFRHLGADYVLGLRFDASSASGDVPFFSAPYVSLRGIPALRYQGKRTAAFEIEARRYFGERWLGSLFTGTGYVVSGFDFGETDNDIFNYGFGLRYLALPKQDAWVGLDIARGPEDTAWYIQMGSSW